MGTAAAFRKVFSFETVERMVTFITNYATVHDLPQPAARSGRAETAHIFLPATEGYNTVHKKHLLACAGEGEQVAKYQAFHEMWHKFLPHIKFMTPRTDVCHHCEGFHPYNILFCFVLPFFCFVYVRKYLYI